MLIDINAPLPPTVLQLPIICLAITSYPCLILLLYSLYGYAKRRKKTIINIIFNQNIKNNFIIAKERRKSKAR